MDDPLREPGRAAGVIELRRVVGRRVGGLEHRPALREQLVIEDQHRSTCSRSIRSALAAFVTSTFGCESVTRCRMPRRRTGPTSTAGSPHLPGPEEWAAVSGVGGNSIATRSPRPTPCATSTFANRSRDPELAPVDGANVALGVLMDHRQLLARVLVTNVGGDVVPRARPSRGPRTPARSSVWCSSPHIRAPGAETAAILRHRSSSSASRRPSPSGACSASISAARRPPRVAQRHPDHHEERDRHRHDRRLGQQRAGAPPSARRARARRRSPRSRPAPDDHARRRAARGQPRPPDPEQEHRAERARRDRERPADEHRDVDPLREERHADRDRDHAAHRGDPEAAAGGSTRSCGRSWRSARPDVVARSFRRSTRAGRRRSTGMPRTRRPRVIAPSTVPTVPGPRRAPAAGSTTSSVWPVT